MNDKPPQRWNPMLSNPDDDFADFLDFGELNSFTFTDDIANIQGAGTGIGQGGGVALDHAMEGTPEALGLGRPDETAHLGQNTTQQEYPMDIYQSTYNLGTASFAQQRQDQGRMQQQWQALNMIPPTPNSMELQAGQVHGFPGGLNYEHQQQAYEQYRRLQKNQMSFTPLISPAVTPLDTQLRYPDSVDFSPLTSPALNAQPLARHSSVYGSVRGSDTSNTTSPTDLSRDYNAPTSVSTASSVRRSRRKMSSGSTKAPARSIKQSPAMKPQHRKKQTSSSSIPSKEVASILENVNTKAGASSKSATADGMLTAPEQSGTDSVSPESLSDILMPPPATPQPSSAGRSPYLNAKQGGPQAPDDQAEEPATPASLMRIRRQAERSATRKREASHLKEQIALAEVNMEDTSFPEPATDQIEKPALRSIDAAQQNAGESSSDRAHNNERTSAPVAASASTLASPPLSALTSPNGPRPRKGFDTKHKGRDPKKRSSTSSEKVSPALRPKISPSIKPLLPEGVSPETSALLLASKSNYQYIVEGTHFPGVSYPENLSTNLTSKRTSHKLAEQGRRNRINTALQEIALLLPPTSPSTLQNGRPAGLPERGETGEDRAAAMMGAGSTAQQQSNSKASTVEAAIDYIKILQKEIEECKGKLAEYEQPKNGDRGQAELVTETGQKNSE